MTGAAVRLADQGCFWVGVTYEERDGHTLPDGTQMYVEYQKPEVQTQPCPVVLVHGGGAQAVDWISTPDGRPGWRTLLLQRGYEVYLVDRPGHGRSARLPVDPGTQPGPGLVPSVEMIGAMFAGLRDPQHTQWPGTGAPDDPALAQLLASFQQSNGDLGEHHALMRRRGAELLDRIGPAIVITSSAGGPSGWLMADERPDLVRAVVGLEPLGPSGPLPLSWGLSASPLTYDPPADPAAGVALVDVPGENGATSLKLQADPPRRLPNLADIPIAILSGERSFANAMDLGTIAYLRQAGCTRVDHLALGDHGVHGNGHLMMIERNNGAALDVVTQWLEKAIV
ncbi:alpha/beta fold hydrolase [Streptomyces justiciae]|uniref:alpha/beta fold hydrolase n=1 Tax=Streptomyces justiciae TaxID=2780140 RepID=UPI002119485D|nr:alpha/beta fold hydrolase [Streptomyces justiciae]MCW8378645.1 alpha/beta fold hydrolase [Streptomyces justiciae]